MMHMQNIMHTHFFLSGLVGWPEFIYTVIFSEEWPCQTVHGWNGNIAVPLLTRSLNYIHWSFSNR